MILTEEQRGALARAIDYINETDLPIGELDGFDREVLRAMIDSSDPITDVTELVELLAAGEHEQWAAWAQAILDSEPGLSDGRKAAWPGLIATPYENLSEEMKDEDRRVVHLRSQVVLDYIQQQSAEIERLRAALDESEQILAHKTKTATHWYEEGLKTRADLVQSKRVVEQQAARLKELEDVHKRSGVKYAKIINELRSSVYANIPGLDVGKIGPDAKPRVWQITEERKAAIDRGLQFLEWSYAKNSAHDTKEQIAVLWAMLDEVGQELPPNDRETS